MDCKHAKTKLKKIEKTVLDLKFKQNAKVCEKCGAYLRDDKFDKSYMAWLQKIYGENREKFQVQCHLSENLLGCVDKLLEQFPGVNMTALLRALVTVYLDYVETDKKILEQFNESMNAEIFSSFSTGTKKKTNIQFKPKMMLDLLAIGELSPLKTHAIVENSIIKMMAACTSTDEELQYFWEENIKKYVDLVLKAA